MSLKSITYEYLYHFHLLRPGAGGGEAERVFSARVLDYLAERGYGAEDVVAWAWILLAGNVRQAVVRLDVWARLGGGGGGESGGLKGAVGEILGGCGSLGPLELLDRPSLRIPPFIILHNLRRPHSHISAPTLRQLLPHVQASLRPRSGDTKTPLLLLIRLLRHARSSWPPAIPHVAKLMANLHPATAAPKRPARLTGTYNRLLALLSLPTHDRPFALMPLLQQSQFTLLRKMAALDIPITREGYRALIAVQLAHPKTAPEAQHVNSLSTLWPPYPVPKDGHRHSPGHPSSPRHLSRAATVLQQMAAAGYHNLGWEKEALVLAGTDTDNTPTIQTRTFHLAGRASARADPQNIWAVRVRATRTLDEAWCVFLDALAAVGVPPPPAWEELFVKVCAARKVSRQQTRHQQRLHEIQAGHDATRAATAETLRAVEQWDVVNRDVGERAKRVLPGDAREVAVWGSEGVHVPVKAPTVEELFAMMRRVCGRQAGVSVRLLAYLVREAETLEQGERLLTTWSAERFRRLLKSIPSPLSFPLLPLLLTPHPSSNRTHHRHPQQQQQHQRLANPHLLPHPPPTRPHPTAPLPLPPPPASPHPPPRPRLERRPLRALHHPAAHHHRRSAPGARLAPLHDHEHAAHPGRRQHAAASLRGRGAVSRRRALGR